MPGFDERSAILKRGKKVNHQSMSGCKSTETLRRGRVDGKARRLFNKRDIKMRPGVMQAAAKESFPSKDFNCLTVSVKFA